MRKIEPSPFLWLAIAIRIEVTFMRHLDDCGLTYVREKYEPNEYTVFRRVWAHQRLGGFDKW